MDEIFFVKFRMYIDQYTTKVLHIFLRLLGPGVRVLVFDKLEEVVISLNIIMRLDDAVIDSFGIALAFTNAVGMYRLHRVVCLAAVLLPSAYRW